MFIINLCLFPSTVWGSADVQPLAAKGVRTRGKRGRRSARIRRLQPRDVQNRIVQQVGRDRRVSVRGELPVRSRNQGAAPSDQAPTLQDWGLPYGARWRCLPLRSPLPFPPLSYWGGEAHGGWATTTTTAALIGMFYLNWVLCENRIYSNGWFVFVDVVVYCLNYDRDWLLKCRK